jgi:iron complex outermembrane receptor protein/outer membrane receptor for ferric coprogen and ferric-rhodotorulic acid
MHSLLSRFCPTPLTQAVLCLGLVMPLQSAMAQTAAPTARFDIAAQPLASALDQLAQQAGLQLVFSPGLAANRQAPAVRGELSARQVLDALLAGSGLEGLLHNGTLTVQPAGGREKNLAEVRVQARRAGDGTTEGTGSYTSRVTSIASKTDQAFREIPQSVSVVTRTQLDDQRATNVTEALKLMPGITVANTVGDFYARGFQITSMQVDGGAPLALGAYTYSPQQDMAFYDRVEVMRGASGLLGGVGDPGGIINIVRKKPLAQTQIQGALSLGSWSRRGAELDVTGPLKEDGSVRGRAVLSYEKGNSFMDMRSMEKPGLYGVLEMDVGADTLLTVGGSYGKTHEKGDYAGLPRFSDGRSLGLPRHTNFTQPWAYYDYENKELFAQLEHRLNKRWKVKLNASRVETELDRFWVYMGGAIDPQTLGGAVWRGGKIQSGNTQDLVDVNLSGAFDLLGRSHELLLGVDWQRIDSYWQTGNFDGSGTVASNPFAPSIWTPDTNTYINTRYGPWGQKQLGAYGTLRLHPSDRLHVILGARAARYDYAQSIWSLNAAGDKTLTGNTPFREPTKITPYGGVIYDLGTQWSSYLSYSSIYNPQALYKAGPEPGTSLSPVKGRSVEAGLKGELLDGRLNATFSVFDVARTGSAVPDPNYDSSYSRWNGNCCFVAQGKVVSRGFDVELGGELRPGWQLAAGYTFNSTQDKSTGQRYSSITPRHLLKLSTAYTLPGTLSPWRVGGSAQIQSKHYVSGSALSGGTSVPFDFTQGGYAVWNAMVHYQIDPHWSLALNINNLFDRTYYQTLGSTFSNNLYGAPRNAMLTLRGRF